MRDAARRTALRCLEAGLLAVLLLVAATAQAADALHITRAERLMAEGHGFARPPAAIEGDPMPGPWTPVDLPHAVRPELPAVSTSAADGGAATVVVWYRVRLDWPDPDAALALYIPRWKADGQIAVYGDGRMLYQSHANLLWNGSNLPLWIGLAETAGAQVPRTLLIRVERLRATGGGMSSLWVGPADAVGWRYRLRTFLQGQLPAMCSAAFLAVGVFSLCVWLMRRREKLYLMFFAVSLASYLRTLHYYVGTERLPIADHWFGWLTVSSLFWLVAAGHLFLNYLHRERRRWLDAAVIAITVTVGLVTLPIGPGGAAWGGVTDATLLAPLIYGVLLLMGITAFTLAFRSSYRVKSGDGMMLAGWSLLGMACGVYDWLLQSNFVDIEGAYLGAMAGSATFFIFLAIMFRRYVGAIADIEELNAQLESRLQAREAELTANHERLRAAEQMHTLHQERQRLMQDMHDGMGSSLTTALRAVELGRMKEAEVAQLLKGCIDDLKLAIDSMEPVDADLLLLLATLRYRLGPRLESTGITLRWKVTPVPALHWLDPKNSLHILRILQEAFTNIIKHTHATVIEVATGTHGDDVVVTVRDNGQGFDVEHPPKGGGKGLSNQVRRAQAIGAEVNWQSGPGGTCFTLRLPVQRGVAAATVLAGSALQTLN